MNNKKSIDELIESIYLLVNEAKNINPQLTESKNANYHLKEAYKISKNLVSPEKKIPNENNQENKIIEKKTSINDKEKESEQVFIKSEINSGDNSTKSDWTKMKFQKAQIKTEKDLKHKKNILTIEKLIENRIKEVFSKELNKWLSRRPKLIKKQMVNHTEKFLRKNITKI